MSVVNWRPAGQPAAANRKEPAVNAAPAAPDHRDTATRTIEVAAPTTGGCGCGHSPAGDLPELDARQIPPQVRHGAIFGALDAVAPGAGLVLVAPHDPVPLLDQVRERRPGAFEVRYLERGPQAWRVAFVRTAG
jgi:uncharacterized protein (DUF2249 family)